MLLEVLSGTNPLANCHLLLAFKIESGGVAAELFVRVAGFLHFGGVSDFFAAPCKTLDTPLDCWLFRIDPSTEWSFCRDRRQSEILARLP